MLTIKEIFSFPSEQVILILKSFNQPIVIDLNINRTQVALLLNNLGLLESYENKKLDASLSIFNLTQQLVLNMETDIFNELGLVGELTEYYKTKHLFVSSGNNLYLFDAGTFEMIDVLDVNGEITKSFTIGDTFFGGVEYRMKFIRIIGVKVVNSKLQIISCSHVNVKNFVVLDNAIITTEKNRNKIFQPSL